MLRVLALLEGRPAGFSLSRTGGFVTFYDNSEIACTNSLSEAARRLLDS